MKTYWIETVIVDNNLKISELKLTEIIEEQDENERAYEEVNTITVSKKEFIEISTKYKVINLVSIDDTSISIKRGKHDKFEFFDEDENFDSWPLSLLVHKNKYIDLRDDNYDDAEKKLKNFTDKAKMLGKIDEYDLDISKSRITGIKNIQETLKFPPVLDINVPVLIRNSTIKEIVVHNETLFVDFPFYQCTRLEKIKLGDRTNHINGLLFIKKIKELNLGGMQYIPTMKKGIKIDKLIVSTRCTIENKNSSLSILDNGDVKELQIVETQDKRWFDRH